MDQIYPDQESQLCHLDRSERVGQDPHGIELKSHTSHARDQNLQAACVYQNWKEWIEPRYRLRLDIEIGDAGRMKSSGGSPKDE